MCACAWKWSTFMTNEDDVAICDLGCRHSYASSSACCRRCAQNVTNCRLGAEIRILTITVLFKSSCATSRKLIELHDSCVQTQIDWTNWEIQAMIVEFSSYCHMQGVCVAYKRVLVWWPHLVHTCTTCYYNWQPTLWHAMSSPVSSTAIFRDSLNSLSCLRSSLYTIGAAPTENTFSNNTYIVCLPIRCLETGSSIAARVRFRGNIFTEPLLSNEIFRLSGVMSHCLFRTHMKSITYLSHYKVLELWRLP
jgi:hypothetical protein